MQRTRSKIGPSAFSLLPTIAAAMVLAAIPRPAAADEGGVSFWVPGIVSSLAAAPAVPGFAFANVFYHSSVRAGADVAFARQVHGGNLTTNFTGNLNINLRGSADLYFAIPSYTFADRFLGAQMQMLVIVPYGRGTAAVNATLIGNLGLGGPGFTLGGARSDEVVGFGDLAPQLNFRWNDGVHNYWTYLTGNLTLGRYNPDRLVNLGIGHNAIDAGGGYTYFNPQTGYEFSATLGFTTNFENTHTAYKNGNDMHLDLGASKFLTKQLQLGAVGYLYNQLSCDSGAGNRVGCFKSRVAGIGPQIGYIIPLPDNHQGYFSLKGYKEFDAEHRASGWNVWLTFAVSPAPPGEAPPPPSRRMITK